MKLTNKELMEEFYNKMLSQFPGLTLEQFTSICHTQFKFLRQQIEGPKIVEVRLKYIGSFQVYPGRAKNHLFNLKERLKYHKIDPKQYKEYAELINTYLKELETNNNVEENETIE